MSTFIDWLVPFLYAALLASVPLLFGTLGEILTEKAGHLNLGVEGMMYMGAAFGFLSGYLVDSAALAILCAFLAGMAGALIYAFLTVTLKANQNVTGLTLTIFGTGLANFMGESLLLSSPTGSVIVFESVRNAVKPIQFGFLTGLPIVGKLLFTQSILTYLAVFAATAMYAFLKHTQAGINLRAIGENPAAADAAGVNVSMYKYLSIMAGGGLCGLGGAYVALVTCVGNWQQNIVSGQGWIAVALVIFASWSPLRAMIGSLVFGALSVLRLYLPKSIIDIPDAFFSMVPFIVTCIILVASSIRMRKENQQPASCGINYFREER
jgi:general nucleoside transport system permease protein